MTTEDYAALCREFGPQVGPLDGLDPVQLLWALGGNESAFGTILTPRHEPAFDVGGSFYNSSPIQQQLVNEFGSDAACSYGPLQIMFCNAPQGSKPSDFDDPQTAMQYSVAFLNQDLRRFKPVTLTTIGQIWNAGSPQSNPSRWVLQYCDKLDKNWSVPMPEAVDANNQ